MHMVWKERASAAVAVKGGFIDGSLCFSFSEGWTHGGRGVAAAMWAGAIAFHRLSAFLTSKHCDQFNNG
jgi:hypothetical protein